MKMIKPEGFDDLIKVTLLGDEFLIDYKENNIKPVGNTTLHPAPVIHYMVEEGFISLEEEETEEPQDSDFSRN